MRGQFSNALARYQVEVDEPIEIFHQFRTHDVASSQMTHRRLFRLVLLPTLALIGGLMACDAVTRVQGTVVGRDGNPIPGAVVRLTLIATGRARQMTTEQDGRFSVELIHGAFPGRFDLVTSKSGYEDNHKEIRAKTSQTLTITLSKSR